jgi:hypothetical protein
LALLIELDLKGAGRLGRALAAVACHRQWRSIRRASGFTSRASRARLKGLAYTTSREDISRRAMRFSVRHLSGLIYDAVDDFVRGRKGPIRTSERNHSSRSQMRFKAEAPSPDRSGWIFLPGPKAPSHSRRSLSLAEFGKCRIDEFIKVGTLNDPIDGGSVRPVAHRLQGAM